MFTVKSRCGEIERTGDFTSVLFGLAFGAFKNISVAISFIGGRNRITRRKLPTCRKSLTNFIT
jgi:hypothetical protein